MLFDLKLSNGFWNQVNREARHINIVLAAGEIQVRFVSKKGANYQTKMVQGMALELPKFDRVEIKGETDQQIKVWVSDVPLSYSPDSSRQVGSNALRSSVGYVYSGYPHALLPAEIGRNKVTLTPQQDIYIGGTNLNTKNGVLLKAGQVFSLATQGAVYALETSGNFQPYFTALADPNEFRPTLTEGNASVKSIYFENKSRTRGWGYEMSSGGTQTSRLYEYDPATLKQTGVSMFITTGSNMPSPRDFYYRGDDILVCVTGNNIYKLNLDTGVIEYYDVRNDAANVAASKPEWYAQSGDDEYVYLQNGNILVSPMDANTWSLASDPAPVTAGNVSTLKGFVVDSNKRIIISNGNQVWFRNDGGAWTQGAMWDIDIDVGTRAMDIDLATDTLYAAGEDGVYKSVDGGVSWVVDYNTIPISGGRSLRTLTCLNGAILAFGVESWVYRNPITEEYTAENIPFGQRSGTLACLSESGMIYFASIQNMFNGDGSYYLDVKGTPSPVAGLPVSIMAEVN